MKRIFHLLCSVLLFSSTFLHAKAYSFEKDVYENIRQLVSKVPDEARFLLGIYSYMIPEDKLFKSILTDKNKDILMVITLISAQEIYAMDFYNVIDEYQKFLKSDAFKETPKKIGEKLNYKHSPTNFITIHGVLYEAAKTQFPNVARVYQSSRLYEIFYSSAIKVHDEAGHEVVKVMLMKKILEKRIKEAKDGFYPADVETVISQLTSDLREYYQRTKCPQDFSDAFLEYLSAFDNLVNILKKRPKELNKDEASGAILVWLLAGRNPFELAAMETLANVNWKLEFQDAEKRYQMAEEKLQKKYQEYTKK